MAYGEIEADDDEHLWEEDNKLGVGRGNSQEPRLDEVEVYTTAQ